MKIFISYSSKDDIIIQSFVDHFLKLGLNISAKEICCTGIEDSKPETGDDFKNWIKENLISADIIILLISQNYKASEVCLNEMGAAWILDVPVIPIILEPIDYKNVGFINNTIQLLKINNRDDLFTLKGDIEKRIGSIQINSAILNQQIDKFLKEIKTVPIFPQVFNKKDLSEEVANFSYFERFLLPDIDYKGLLLQAQPTISDCKLIFIADFYKDVYDYYNIEYKNLLEIQEIVNDFSEYNTFEYYSATYDQLKENNHELPGGMTLLTKHNSIRSNVRFYMIRFRKMNNNNGTTFTAWTYINNRWVLFVKPWHIVEFVVLAKNNTYLNTWIKILKRFKVLKRFNTFELQYLINRIK